VKRWRPLLVVIVLYVGLDFALPDMPGAFVFDPAGSVESTDVARARPTAKIVVLPGPPPLHSFSAAEQPESEPRVPPNLAATPQGRPMVNRLPRAACALSAPSEDSH
jgi:hypothetical protein